jgi:hypothetical protein
MDAATTSTSLILASIAAQTYWITRSMNKAEASTNRRIDDLKDSVNTRIDDMRDDMHLPVKSTKPPVE